MSEEKDERTAKTNDLKRDLELLDDTFFEAFRSVGCETAGKDFSGPGGTVKELQYHVGRMHKFILESLFKAAFFLNVGKLPEAKNEYMRADSILRDAIIPRIFTQTKDPECFCGP